MHGKSTTGHISMVDKVGRQVCSMKEFTTYEEFSSLNFNCQIFRHTCTIVPKMPVTNEVSLHTHKIIY